VARFDVYRDLAVTRKSLGEKAGSLEAQAAEILAAVDFLISGF
jgi:hypothetical protein